LVKIIKKEIKKMKQILKLCSLLLLVIGVLVSCETKEEKVLVFSKTMGFRHGSIASGIKAVKRLGTENGFKVDATEDASFFTEETLSQYAAVIFMNTTGDILDAVQQADFERYIQAGGGFVGVHSATDTEYEWPWYNKLVGAYFLGHPKVQDATLNILDKGHESTKSLDDTWIKKDEWYNFKDINPDVNVLIEIDETSYEGGANGEHHPIAWYHNYDGGRAFYTEMGHTNETFENPTFVSHLLGGISYAIGSNIRDYALAKTERVPVADRYKREILDFNLNEPMELEELPGKGILFVERRGVLKLYDFEASQTKVIANLEVFYGNEDGLLGLAIDPNYIENNWIYLFYSKAGPESIETVSRFTLKGDVLDLASEKKLLEVPSLRKCCHAGGALEFGPNGNLFIGLGDNTNPFESSGYAPIDERPGRALWDAQKSAGNTNDLRGKILRIKPEDDGTYSIPEGNLFPVGTPKSRPEIYTMGLRNPFRFSVDSKTGYLYWGDVGPDAGEYNPDRGPHGMGEFNQARKAGNWGWPYTRGNNQGYNDYDFAKKESGAKFDPNNLINNSPNNTGMKKLPPAQKSMIWFSYGKSEEFPWLGSGGVNPMAGPIFHKSDYPKAKQTFPSYFEDKVILYEWMRDWIYVVTLDENGEYIKADEFMPKDEFSHPMDMIFGSDGSLYVLEYGQKWNSQNMDARLNKITYLEGNRNPIAKASADKIIGAQPFKVQFLGEESLDYDKDELAYEWSFTGSDVQSTEMNPSFTFNEVGTFNVVLKVTDKEGLSSSATTKVLVGNDPPVITLEIDPSDANFWDDKKVNYKVVVTDRQDGSSTNGTIDASDVKVTFNYIPQGKDIVKATIGHQRNTIDEGKQVIDGSDCKACHAIAEKVNGPSYKSIAAKYSKEDLNYLTAKVIKGGSGVWGKESMMSAHPQLSVEDVKKSVEYILSFKEDKNGVENKLPLEGTLSFNEHLAKDNEGVYILIASYMDKGNAGQADSSIPVREQIVFRNLKVEAEDANQFGGGLKGDWKVNEDLLIGSIVDGTFLRFDKINLKNLKQIKLATFYRGSYQYEGVLEIREGSKTGKVIGEISLGNKGMGSKDVKKYNTISVKPTADKAPLFFVFKNEKNKSKFIVGLDWILPIYKR
jgi:cytochrome c